MKTPLERITASVGMLILGAATLWWLGHLNWMSRDLDYQRQPVSGAFPDKSATGATANAVTKIAARGGWQMRVADFVMIGLLLLIVAAGESVRRDLSAIRQQLAPPPPPAADKPQRQPGALEQRFHNWWTG